MSRFTFFRSLPISTQITSLLLGCIWVGMLIATVVMLAFQISPIISWEVYLTIHVLFVIVSFEYDRRLFKRYMETFHE